MKFVYQYKVYDIKNDVEIIATSFATEEFISKIEGAKILYETVLKVNYNQIDGDGKLVLNEKNFNI